MNIDQIYINGLSSKAILYKFIPLKYLVDMLKKDRLYLKKVSSWEDPYENFFLKQNFVDKNGKEMNLDERMFNYFGTCWTTSRETDAMWRIYSFKNSNTFTARNKNKLSLKLYGDVAIRISISAKTLINSISNGKTKDLQFVRPQIGRVKYYNHKEMKLWFANKHDINSAQEFGKAIMESLFIKRKPFIHENEVRVILYCENVNGNDDSLYCKFDAKRIFQNFVIDPRIKDKKVIKEISQIIESCGIKPNRITQSSLYKIEPNNIIIHSL